MLTVKSDCNLRREDIPKGEKLRHDNIMITCSRVDVDDNKTKLYEGL